MTAGALSWFKSEFGSGARKAGLRCRVALIRRPPGATASFEAAIRGWLRGGELWLSPELARGHCRGVWWPLRQLSSSIQVLEGAQQEAPGFIKVSFPYGILPNTKVVLNFLYGY